jgi:hypothetical protein
VTEAPVTTISPTRSSGSGRPSSSTTPTRTPVTGGPQPTRTCASASVAYATELPGVSALASTHARVQPVAGGSPVTTKVASAIPYAGSRVSRRRPCGDSSRVNASSVPAWTRSAPTIRAFHREKSRPDSDSGGTRRAM